MSHLGKETFIPLPRVSPCGTRDVLEFASVKLVAQVCMDMLCWIGPKKGVRI